MQERLISGLYAFEEPLNLLNDGYKNEGVMNTLENGIQDIQRAINIRNDQNDSSSLS